MSTDSHDRMIKAFQNYFIHQDHFDNNMSDEAGKQARYWLSQIRFEASLRRKEIQKIRAENKKIRNGQNGRPPRDKYDHGPKE